MDLISSLQEEGEATDLEEKDTTLLKTATVVKIIQRTYTSKR